MLEDTLLLNGMNLSTGDGYCTLGKSTFILCRSLGVRNVELEAGDQGSDSLSACLISLLCCPKHHTVEQQRGRQDLTIIHPTQNILKTRIQGFRIAVKDFALAEEDVVTNRR